jgi:diadenosine tetraphosphate (Ap4A) HIT family hydrolase
MPEPLSVDPLYGFGAKIFSGCTEFKHLHPVMTLNAVVSRGHSGVLPDAVGLVLVRNRQKCSMTGRRFIVKGRAFEGMLPSCRLVRPPPGRSTKLNIVDQPGVHPVFALDSRLQQDTLTIGDFPLCRLLLSNDANYPWFILVPRRDDISELFQLDVADQQRLWQETTALAEVLKDSFDADKMNVATLGNVVSQMHMHVIVRKRDDIAWPAPVWGKHPAKPYSAEQVAVIRERLRLVLDEDFKFLEG